MKALICRPKFDSATEYTFAFAAEILEWCQQAGIEVTELAEEDAARPAVENALERFNPDILVFYDHGDKDALIVQDGKAVIDIKNCDRLAGKEVFTLACLSAKDLGPEVWRKGGTYWGYTEVVSFATDSLPEFQEAFNCGFHYRWLEGDTRQSALTRAKETFTRLSVELVAAGNTLAAIFMRENGDNLVYLDAHKPEEKEGCLLGLLKLPIKIWRN